MKLSVSSSCLAAIGFDSSTSDSDDDGSMVAQAPPSPRSAEVAAAVAVPSPEEVAAAKRKAEVDAQLMPPPKKEHCAPPPQPLVEDLDLLDPYSESSMPGSCMPAIDDSSHGQSVRFLDHVYQNAGPLIGPRIVDFNMMERHCVREFVDPSCGEPIFWDMCSEDLSYREQLEHCLVFIKAMKKRKFYVGMTHSPVKRWSNTDHGHKWARDLKWCDMVVLCHLPLEHAHPIEKAVCYEVFHGALSGLQHLIVNQPATAPGPQVADGCGWSWIYCLRGALL